MTDPIRTALETLTTATESLALAAETPMHDGDQYAPVLHDAWAALDIARAALAAASPEPERCATCGQSRDGLKHRCWSTHFRRVREAGDGLHVTTDCHPFQSAPAAPSVEALRDALLDDLRAMYDQGHMEPWDDRLDAIIAAARADERTRRSGIMTAEEYQEAFGEPAALAAASPEPHRYSPDAMAMGDCKVCGRIWEDHQPPTPPESVEALRAELVKDAVAAYQVDAVGRFIYDPPTFRDRLIELEAAARADERTRLAGGERLRDAVRRRDVDEALRALDEMENHP